MGCHPFFMKKASNGLANTPRALVEDKGDWDGGWGKGEQSVRNKRWRVNRGEVRKPVKSQSRSPELHTKVWPWITIWDRIWEMRSIKTSLSCVRVGESRRGREEPPRASPPWCRYPRTTGLLPRAPRFRAAWTGSPQMQSTRAMKSSL